MEIMPTVQGIDYLRRNVRRWMRPRARRVAMQFRPGTARVVLQPLGVVGIVSPWNYPMSLCLMPLATAIAAGNRAMLKPSEHTPKTSDLLGAMLREAFPEDQVAVVTGGADVGEAFAALPFDHLVFTGSTGVGRAVMRAASANLVPVTLELGGKSPAIVDRGFPPARAARSIAFGKLANAGQTCIAPDYALVHESDVDAFVEAFGAAARAAYPGGTADAAYTAIISQRHYDRLAALIEDARGRGAKIVEIGAAPGTRGRPQIAAHAHRRRDAGDDRHAGRDLRPDPSDHSIQGNPGRDRVHQREPAAPRPLCVQRRPRGRPPGARPHDERQCDSQRYLAPLRAGRPSVRRRRTERDGRLPRRGGLPGAQPCEGRLHPGPVELRWFDARAVRPAHRSRPETACCAERTARCAHPIDRLFDHRHARAPNDPEPARRNTPRGDPRRGFPRHRQHNQTRMGNSTGGKNGHVHDPRRRHDLLQGLGPARRRWSSS